MNKFYSFTLYDGSQISFHIPISDEGNVIAHRFMPDFLSPTRDCIDNEAVLWKAQTIDPIEFETDCRTMLGNINGERLPPNLDTSYRHALVYTLINHINRFHRLLYSDLCAYIDEVTYLMYGFGFREKDLQNRIYPQFAYIAISNMADYVKDYDDSLGIFMPFTGTLKWRRIVEYCKTHKL